VSVFRVPITGAGLQHLRDLRRLEELQLSGRGITDAGLEHLRGLAALHDLYLSDTRVTEAGTGRRGEAIPALAVHH
jgi:hypothetical protein